MSESLVPYLALDEPVRFCEALWVPVADSQGERELYFYSARCSDEGALDHVSEFNEGDASAD